MKIFALPYAGGSSAMYMEMKRLLRGIHDMTPVEYPGHGYRMGEMLCTSMEELTEIAVQFVLEQKGNEPYAILGYSMGGNVAYEVCRMLEKKKKSEGLQHLFLCACTPPNVDDGGKDIRAMSEEDALQLILNLNGTDMEDYREEEFMKYFFPILKNDIALYQAYKAGYQKKSERRAYEVLKTKGSLFFSIEEGHIDQWNQFFETEPKFQRFSGGHFFIRKHTQGICDAICAILS